MSKDNQAALARAQQQAADRLKHLERRQGTTNTAEYRRLAERSFRIANR